MRRLLLLCFCLLTAAQASAQPLALRGDPALQKLTRRLLKVIYAIDPSQASSAGLMEWGDTLPTFRPARVAAWAAELRSVQEGLRRLPYRRWPKAIQVDFRYVYAQTRTYQLLLEEKSYQHRSAAWLEPTANHLLALVTYAPHREDLQILALRQIPAMLAEIPSVCTHPTERDVHTSLGVLAGLEALCASPTSNPELALQRQQTLASLRNFRAYLESLHDLPQYEVIGKEAYERRLREACLLEWNSDQLLALAQKELERVDARIAELQRTLPPAPEPTDDDRRAAAELDQARLESLYDRIARLYRKRLENARVLTIPPQVGPIRARATPEAMIPLTGDGGSMNPPPTIGSSNVGWWNVEHVRSDWTPEQRLETYRNVAYADVTGIGPYAAHEGVPGHHLQLSIARLNPDPMRSILYDSVQCEGWALYAEEMFHRAGGYGPSPRSELCLLGSYRARIRRVFYDVHIETGRWTLQQGADWKYNRAAGQGTLDEDLCRSIHWPTQLIGYFTGKQQILALQNECRVAWGPNYSDRRFHDELLRAGSIPLSLIRAELLDLDVPRLDP